MRKKYPVQEKEVKYKKKKNPKYKMFMGNIELGHRKFWQVKSTIKRNKSLAYLFTKMKTFKRGETKA
jgi:hypothetical protein